MTTPQHTIQLPANYRVSVKALIKNPGNDQEFMLVREADGPWELPGGGLDHGELPHIGLAREIQEELGVEASKISDSPAGIWTIYKKVSDNLGYFGFVLYEVGLLSHDYTANDEAVEVKFFTKQSAQKLDLHDNVKDWILI